MEESISLLKLGKTLEEIAKNLSVSAVHLREFLAKKYPIPEVRRTVGIEIEGFSNVGANSLVLTLRKAGLDITILPWQQESVKNISGWVLTTDGSVKGFKGQNGQKGMELVSPPMLGKLESLQKVLKVIRDGEIMGGLHNIFRVNKTCGIHIHFGKQNMTLDVVERVYTLYRIFEPYLDCLLADSRMHNTNCRSISGLPFAEAYHPRSGKHWSVRTKPDMVTIEFRKHQASTSFHRIHMWILILQQLIEYAEKTALVSILDIRPNYSYLYKIIDNPNLIAYYNARRKHFMENGSLNRETLIDTATKIIQQSLKRELSPVVS